MIPTVAVFAGFFVLCVWLVVRGQRRPVVIGPDVAGGRARPGGGGHRRRRGPGKVVFHGEIWDAVADVATARGRPVVVTEVEGRLARSRSGVD